MSKNCSLAVIGNNSQGKVNCGPSKKAVQKLIKDALAAEGERTENWSRVLIPDKLPTPPNACSSVPVFGSSDKMTVILGSSTSFCTKDQCNILAAVTPDRKQKVLLSVSRKKDILLLSARIFNAQGNLMAKLDNDKPDRDPVLWQTPDRPDASTLRILDNRDELLMSVHFLNKEAISVEGTFYAPAEEHANSRRKLVVTNSSYLSYVDGKLQSSIMGLCVGDNSGADFVF